MTDRFRAAPSERKRHARSLRHFAQALAFGLAYCVLAAPPALAQGAPTAGQNADWESRLARAAELRHDGEAHQEAADKRYETQEAACYKKFFVNRCRDDAFREFTESHRAGKRLENEGKAIERQVKKEQLSARDLEAAARAPERAAKLEVLKEETAAVRNEAELEEATKRAEKARKAEEGARRKAEEAERLRQKQAEHDARVAEKMEKAATKANAKAVEGTPAKP